MLSLDPCFSLVPVFLDPAPTGYMISPVCYPSDGEKVSIAAALLCLPILADPIWTHGFPISACLAGCSGSSAWFQPESCPAQHKHWRHQVCSAHVGWNKSKLFVLLLLLLLYLSSFTPQASSWTRKTTESLNGTQGQVYVRPTPAGMVCPYYLHPPCRHWHLIVWGFSLVTRAHFAVPVGGWKHQRITTLLYNLPATCPQWLTCSRISLRPYAHSWSPRWDSALFMKLTYWNTDLPIMSFLT